MPVIDNTNNSQPAPERGNSQSNRKREQLYPKQVLNEFLAQGVLWFWLLRVYVWLNHLELKILATGAYNKPGGAVREDYTRIIFRSNQAGVYRLERII